MTFDEWRRMWPLAAADLDKVFVDEAWAAAGTGGRTTDSRSEQAVQQEVRLSAAQQGALCWRNNVGAMAAKTYHQCPSCSFRFEEVQQPLRWGLANDSPQMNKRVKSSDLILCIPRVITSEMVGSTIGQFGAIEVKEASWRNVGNDHERAQENYLALVASKGGFATFATGAIQL